MVVRAASKPFKATLLLARSIAGPEESIEVTCAAPSAAHADRAARAYKDINRLAFKILEPGGVLFTYSCSGGIGAELFHKIVASAGTDAGVDG